jgi:diguanylate cyclase (GGDEF)-like protein
MSAPEPSAHAVRSAGEAVARAEDVNAAYETVVSEIAELLHTRAVLYEKQGHQWAPAAGAADGHRIDQVQPVLNRLSPGEQTRVAVTNQDQAHDPWTAVALHPTGGPPVSLLLQGDLTAPSPLTTTWPLVISFALRTVRERVTLRAGRRLIIDGYAMARRLSRLGTVESVGQCVVDRMAELLAADRVALALYRPVDDCLSVIATHGYPLPTVEEVRISPGAWVIGHVYSSGRPLLVRDVRDVRGIGRESPSYATFSFAAVPLFAGNETVGVITATDKRDRSAFSARDVGIMRAMAVTAAMAVVGARTRADASRLAYSATIDSVTGLLNRPSFDQRLRQEVERAKRTGHPLTVLMADIDDFKPINDAHGHQVGDAVLHAVGSVVRSSVRVFDVCARHGGDEFAILMPNSNYSSASVAAERIRRRVAEYVGGSDARGSLPPSTLSIGIAVVKGGDTAAELMLRADQALYQAKADGKNVVRPATAEPYGGPADRDRE